MSDLIKTIRLGFVKYIEVDAEDIAYEYIGDDLFHVEECTGTEWLRFDSEKKKSFAPIFDGFLHDALTQSDLDYEVEL